MTKNKSNKSWLNNHKKDPYVRQAQKEDYRSRAAYKLKEMDEESRLIKSGQVVVDLGAAPGSWSQYVARKMGHTAEGVKGRVIGIDLLPMEPLHGVTFLEGDFREADVLEKLEALLDGEQADVILSDMAPNISGISSADAARMEYLLDLALDFAARHLKPSGTLLVKCFNGPGYNEMLQKFRTQFKTVSQKKPKASRSQSAEVYLMGQQLK